MEIILVVAVIYFVPSFIGCSASKHPNPVGLFIVNLFLGWTFLGWVCALAWAFSRKQ